MHRHWEGVEYCPSGAVIGRAERLSRVNRFDQGVLSKIQNSVTTNLSLESVLRLSIGLSIPPQKIFGLMGRLDLHQLVIGAYSDTFRT